MRSFAYGLCAFLMYQRQCDIWSINKCRRLVFERLVRIIHVQQEQMRTRVMSEFHWSFASVSHSFIAHSVRVKWICVWAGNKRSISFYWCNELKQIPKYAVNIRFILLYYLCLISSSLPQLQWRGSFKTCDIFFIQWMCCAESTHEDAWKIISY